MATSTIKGGVEEFTLTAIANTTTINSQYCYYDKNRNVVHIEFTAQTSGTFGSGTGILNVPASYRPSEVKRGESVSFISSSNTTIPHYVLVATNGDISQSASGGTTHLFGLINYALN